MFATRRPDDFDLEDTLIKDSFTLSGTVLVCHPGDFPFANSLDDAYLRFPSVGGEAGLNSNPLTRAAIDASFLRFGPEPTCFSGQDASYSFREPDDEDWGGYAHSLTSGPKPGLAEAMAEDMARGGPSPGQRTVVTMEKLDRSNHDDLSQVFPSQFGSAARWAQTFTACATGSKMSSPRSRHNSIKRLVV